MAQRLVRRLCPHCRVAWKGRTAAGAAIEGFAASAGCERCLGGYRGRTGLYELLVVDPGMQEAVRTGAGAVELRALGLQRGMRTLASHGLDLVRSGGTSYEELVRTCGSQLAETPT
jgi:protein transport protein HofB